MPPRPQRAVTRYGTTAALVVLCFFVFVGLHGHGCVLAFYTLFPAIIAASVLFDRSAGIFATALGVVSVYLLMRPESLLLPGELLLPLVVFVLIAFGLVIVSEALRTGWERAVAAEQAKDLLLRELGHRPRHQCESKLKD